MICLQRYCSPQIRTRLSFVDGVGETFQGNWRRVPAKQGDRCPCLLLWKTGKVILEEKLPYPGWLKEKLVLLQKHPGSSWRRLQGGLPPEAWARPTPGPQFLTGLQGAAEFPRKQRRTVAAPLLGSWGPRVWHRSWCWALSPGTGLTNWLTGRSFCMKQDKLQSQRSKNTHSTISLGTEHSNYVLEQDGEAGSHRTLPDCAALGRGRRGLGKLTWGREIVL